MSRWQGRYCFTLDDNIRFLEEAVCRELPSLLEHPYPAMLRQLHERYGACFQMNMFFSYDPGGFSLADVPSCWRQELEANRSWLRFSFHGRHNDPPFPYGGEAGKCLPEDFDAGMTELRRIAGRAATGETTTIHYVCADQAACQALTDRGVRGLIGMFLPLEGPEALRYYLTAEQAESLRHGSFWKEQGTGLWFVRNDLVLNQHPLPAIVPALQERHQDFYQVMIHEQYFYPDYPDYQPDFRQKLQEVLEWFGARGLTACFLEDVLPGD